MKQKIFERREFIMTNIFVKKKERSQISQEPRKENMNQVQSLKKEGNHKYQCRLKLNRDEKSKRKYQQK